MKRCFFNDLDMESSQSGKVKKAKDRSAIGRAAVLHFTSLSLSRHCPSFVIHGTQACGKGPLSGNLCVNWSTINSRQLEMK